ERDDIRRRVEPLVALLVRLEEQIRHYCASVILARVPDPAIEPRRAAGIAVFGEFAAHAGEIRPLHDLLGVAILLDLREILVIVARQAAASLELRLAAGDLLIVAPIGDSLRPL